MNERSKKANKALLAAAAFLMIISSCATYQESSESSDKRAEKALGITSTQEALIDAAHWAEGRSNVSNNGKKFKMDCSGVISALYWRAGIDLQSCYPRYTGNGVARIYQCMEDEELLYRPEEPAPGDILFWDNSYDKNGNGVADDELTHIGMAVSVDEDGLVKYVHFDYISGIIFAQMYPPNPSDRSLNSGMRIQSLGPTPEGRITSGDLYRAAARGWELAD